VIDTIKTLRWKPVLAGVLCFVCAGPPIWVSIIITSVTNYYFFLQRHLPYVIVGVCITIALSILGFIGGYYTLKRTHFVRAMTGAIAAAAAMSIMFFWIGAEQDPSSNINFWRQVYIAVPVSGASMVAIAAAVLTGKKSVYIPLTSVLVAANIGMDYYFFYASVRYHIDNPFVEFFPIMLAGLGGLFPVILLILSRREFR
jgi:hypothetical protein